MGQPENQRQVRGSWRKLHLLQGHRRKVLFLHGRQERRLKEIHQACHLHLTSRSETLRFIQQQLQRRIHSGDGTRLGLHTRRTEHEGKMARRNHQRKRKAQTQLPRQAAERAGQETRDGVLRTATRQLLDSGVVPGRHEPHTQPSAHRPLERLLHPTLLHRQGRQGHDRHTRTIRGADTQRRIPRHLLHDGKHGPQADEAEEDRRSHRRHRASHTRTTVEGKGLVLRRVHGSQPRTLPARQLSHHPQQ